MEPSGQNLYKQAYLLSLFTIFYNIAEGVVSMLLGYEDETLTLFGFGADSFIEVMSGIGIAVMILRIRKSPSSPKTKSEMTALKNYRWGILFVICGIIGGYRFKFD